MPHSHDLFCIDGCGVKLGSVTLPDEVQFKGNAHYGLMVPGHARIREASAEIIRRDAEREDFRERLGSVVGSGFIQVDPDAEGEQPSIWVRLRNAFLGGS